MWYRKCLIGLAVLVLAGWIGGTVLADGGRFGGSGQRGAGWSGKGFKSGWGGGAAFKRGGHGRQGGFFGRSGFRGGKDFRGRHRPGERPERRDGDLQSRLDRLSRDLEDLRQTFRRR